LKYKIFTEDPLDEIKEIILDIALPFIIKEKQPNNVTHKKIYLLIAEGLDQIGKSNIGKSIYELYFGCLFTIFLNKSHNSIKYKFILAEPEDNSYDFLVLRYPKNPPKEHKIIGDTKILYCDQPNSRTLYKFELTEVRREEELKTVISKKCKGNKDYRGRSLLVVLRFEGDVDFRDLFNWALNMKQDNFEFIYLMYKELLTLKYFLDTFNLANRRCFSSEYDVGSDLINLLEKDQRFYSYFR